MIAGDRNTVNYLGEEIAIAAIQGASEFAETSANMNLAMQQENADLVATTMSALAGRQDKMGKMITLASVGTIAAVLIMGARK